MAKFSVSMIAGKHLVQVHCDTVTELNRAMDECEVKGWKPYFGGIDDFSVKVTDSIFSDYVDDKPVQKPFHCPIHNNTKIRDDRDGDGKYCASKPDGKWCGCKFDKEGRVTRLPYTMQATQGPIDF